MYDTLGKFSQDFMFYISRNEANHYDEYEYLMYWETENRRE